MMNFIEVSKKDLIRFRSTQIREVTRLKRSSIFLFLRYPSAYYKLVCNIKFWLSIWAYWDLGEFGDTSIFYLLVTIIHGCALKSCQIELWRTYGLIFFFFFRFVGTSVIHGSNFELMGRLILSILQIQTQQNFRFIRAVLEHFLSNKKVK